MDNPLAPSVTTRDGKGLKFMSIVEAAYNKARFSEDEAQRINDTPGLAELIDNFFAANRDEDKFKVVRVEWQKFYKKHFKLATNFFVVQVPEKPSEGLWRLLFIPVGLTMNATLAVMRVKFKVWTTYSDDLDASVLINTRTSATSYAVWVRTGEEPDEKYRGQNTRQADMEGKIGMTLLERLVLEVKYFVETGNNLDVKGVTFCTGSRYSDGSVPSVYFSSDTGEVEVYWYYVDSSNPTYGLRQAVSL